MAFRADEAIINGNERVKNFLIPVGFPLDAKAKGAKILEDIIHELGPAVDAFPFWHPMVHQHDPSQPETTPSERTGYKGLDHTVYFANGFITCPYHNGDAVFESVSKLNHQSATITAEKLNTPFYSESATPIVVKCKWHEPLGPDKLVPKNIAVPLMIEQKLLSWRESDRAEKWEHMRPYLLGSPHGSRSSLFVNQETALAMKKVYLGMVESGMFGPLKTA